MGSGRALACYLLGAALLVLFVVQERRVGDEAILPLKLFRHPVFSVAGLMKQRGRLWLLAPKRR